MILCINEKPEIINENLLTVADLLSMKNINSGGTAVAVNNHLVTRNQWEQHELKDGDRITIISAAYGG